MMIEFYILLFSALAAGAALGLVISVKKILDLEKRLLTIEEKVLKIDEKIEKALEKTK